MDETVFHPIISRYLNVGLKKRSHISFHKSTSKCLNITVSIGSTLRPSREYTLGRGQGVLIKWASLKRGVFFVVRGRFSDDFVTRI